MTPTEQALLDKHRRGEAITPQDQLPTIRCEEELNAFAIGLQERDALDGNMRIQVELRRRDLQKKDRK